MRDFFHRQQRAREQTRRLIVFFALALLLIVVCVYLAVRGIYLWHRLDSLEGPLQLWDPAMFAAVALATMLLVAGGSVYKIRQLRQGCGRVAELLGGRRLQPGTQNPDERRLWNVVEEMAIASGIPVPDVYALDRERGINAFAAGFGTDDAMICVTRGALCLLDRDELQGVVAHEFSHILNADTRINLRLMGWLHGILLVGLTGEGILRGLGRTRNRGGAAFILLGFALYLFGSLGVFCGRLIKSAVSRQREYLADASAVQFSRNPAGLAGALKKIGGVTGEGRIAHPRAGEVSHMCFSDGLGARLAAVATHPPLLERILALDPRFDGRFPAVEPLPAPGKLPPRTPAKPLPPSTKPAQIVSGAAAAAILETVGTPMHEHAEQARTLLANLPTDLHRASESPPGACALTYLLLLDREEALRTRQLELLRSTESPFILQELERLLRHLPLSATARLPLLDLCLPSLRNLSYPQYTVFRRNLDELTAADGRTSLFEFTLRHVLLRHLGPCFGEPRRQVTQIYGLRGALRESSCILSLLARVGHADESVAAEAFERGKRVLHETNAEPFFIPTEECTSAAVEDALKVLAMASPLIKRKLLAACLECLTHDDRITPGEIELFRAVADALDCPVPLWLQPQE